MADRVIETKLHSFHKLPNSTNGNPRYDLRTADGVFRMQPDTMAAYKISGYLAGRNVRLHIGSRDQVFGIDVEGEDY